MSDREHLYWGALAGEGNLPDPPIEEDDTEIPIAWFDDYDEDGPIMVPDDYGTDLPPY